MTLSNKLYDGLKVLALVVLPAFAVMYLGLGHLWKWPSTDEIAGSITLVDTFMGVLLQLWAKQYANSDASHDGSITATGVDEDTGHPNLTMTINKLPADLLAKKTVRLKVNKPAA